MNQIQQLQSVHNIDGYLAHEKAYIGWDFEVKFNLSGQQKRFLLNILHAIWVYGRTYGFIRPHSFH